ncbi:MAG: hypothetical protein JWO03_2499 [Bacteroidetes bacterium]|nr:hypothetical protein [Bacteroidota bacterium]
MTSDIIILIVTLVVVISAFAYGAVRYRMDEEKIEHDANKE